MTKASDVREPNIFVYRTAWIVLFIIYKIFFRFKVHGRENVPKGERGIILTPNHQSYLDPPLVGISLRRPVTYLAKDYLFKAPLLGLVIRALGAIPIKSENKKSDLGSIRQLLKNLQAGKQILVFPEGTRSWDGQFQKPEEGVGFLAIKSKAHVVPAYIHGTFAAYPKGAKWFKCRQVNIFFGRSFIPAEDENLLKQADPYLAVSEKIMQEIEKIKAAARL